MDVLDAVRGRRSIRAFKSQGVPAEIVEKLVDAARWAPSAGNIQPWEFIIVRKPEIKRRLAEAALDQTFIEEAPVVIVVCANETRSSQGYGIRGRNLYCIQDTAAAIQNILLVAYSLGLGTCWIGAFREEEAREILKVPRGIRPVAIVPVGYPDETPLPRSKRPIKQIVHYEIYRETSGPRYQLTPTHTTLFGFQRKRALMMHTLENLKPPRHWQTAKNSWLKRQLENPILNFQNRNTQK